MGTESNRWWSQAGSNRRPLACHASALPAELWPRQKGSARYAGRPKSSSVYVVTRREPRGASQALLLSGCAANTRVRQTSYGSHPELLDTAEVFVPVGKTDSFAGSAAGDWRFRTRLWG